MGGAARRVSAALLEALSSHTQKPPPNKAEGAGKKENAGAMHGRELMARNRDVKDLLLTNLEMPL